MYQKLLYLFLILLSFSGKGFGQKTFADLEKSELFSTENEIVNGEIWSYQKKYVGHPFWNENIWYKGSVTYKSIKYKNVAVRYDIHDGELIIFKEVNGENRSFKLNPNFIKEFSIYKPNSIDTIFFEKIDLPNLNISAVFAKVFEHKSSYYINYRKTINNVVSGAYTGEYLLAPQMYANVNGQFVEFDSKSDFIGLFAPRQNEIKKFMRKNRIKFKRKNPENLIPVFQYFDSIREEPTIN